MQHPNLSTNSLHDNNYYDISISLQASSKKYHHVYAPKRVGSMPSLADAKRPGDYYIQKLSNSSLHLPSSKPPPLPSAASANNTHRPISGDSILSLQSNLSDDISLVGSSPFDVPDSRLSSLTSNSIISPLDSPAINSYQFQHNNVSSPNANTSDNNSIDETTEEHIHVAPRSAASRDVVENTNSSLSTITLKSPYTKSKASDSTSSLSQISPSPRQMLGSRPKASSTVNIPHHPPHPKRSASVSSAMPPLTRSATRYHTAKESKERKQMRKKVYDDNEYDDEILLNDLDFVFNVPVIKNHAEIYIKNDSSKFLSHSDLIGNNDGNKYNTGNFGPSSPSTSRTSFQSPSRSNSSRSLGDVSRINNPSVVAENSILEEEEDQDRSLESEYSSASFLSNDTEITHNISHFYNERSISFTKLAKQSREQNMMHKLPKYIRSQSSLEDLNLISPEKLEAADQTRPINLPPKSVNDKMKHNKEFHKVLTNFEASTKTNNESRKKLFEQFALNQQHWFKLMLSLKDHQEFNKKLTNDKIAVRKLAWDSNVPDKNSYDFFHKVLLHQSTTETTNDIKNLFRASDAKYKSLSPQMRVSKDNEFNKIIDSVLDRPLFRSILEEFEESPESVFDLGKLKSNFKYLLYIHSLSETGLKKHDEAFLIPVFLILFPEQSVSEVNLIVELFNQQILSSKFLSELNKSLDKWSSLSSWSSANIIYKTLSKFSSLKEFEQLNANNFFQILTQINDKLPLSLSAPSTPITAQAGAFAMTSSPTHNLPGNASGVSSPGISATTSVSSLNDALQNLSTVNAGFTSSSFNLIVRFLQLLVVYANSPKSKNKNNLKVFQSFLLIIFKYYHINWNSYDELIRNNKSIRLNHSLEQAANLDSFADKWKDAFKRL